MGDIGKLSLPKAFLGPTMSPWEERGGTRMRTKVPEGLTHISLPLLLGPSNELMEVNFILSFSTNKKVTYTFQENS